MEISNQSSNIHLLQENLGLVSQLGNQQHIMILDSGNSGTFTATYSGLKNWSYKGKPITKIVFDFTMTKNITDGHLNVIPYSPDKMGGKAADSSFYDIDLSNDPTKGFILNGTTATVIAKMYYDDGSQVSFDPNTAYFAVGSLNNYTNMLDNEWHSMGYSIESTKVNYGGSAKALYESSVTVHNGNNLYSDLPNTISNSDTTGGAIFNPNITYDGHYGEWDSNGSGKQYVGAGLIDLNGNEFSFTAGTLNKGIPQNAIYRNYMWWNASTVIPETPTTEINYHYDTILTLKLIIE